MIRILVREQLRAQRRFVTVTGIVLALAVGVASYGLLMTTTMREANQTANATLGYDKQWHLWSSATVGTPTQDLGYPTLAVVDAALDRAIADGSDVVATRGANIGYPGIGQGTPEYSGSIALKGAVDWSAILAQGDPPQPGQIALSAGVASAAGVGIGDPYTITVHSCPPKCETRSVTLTVSGIARSGFTALGLSAYAPDAFTAWDDTAGIEQLLGSPGDTNRTVMTGFSWNTGSSALDVLGSAENYTASAGALPTAVTGAAAAGVGALVVGLIAMAFAIGRAQAQVRSRWVATARTLGATRGTIAAASIVESAGVGLTAGAIGSALGYAAGSAHLTLLHRAVAEPLFPSRLATPWWAVPGLLLLGLVLSTIIGAIPAFWSARVAPVAALKPVTDLSEADVSRRVSARPLFVIWIASNAALAFTAVMDAPGALLGPAVVAGLVIVVGGIMLMHEALRWAVPRVGASLSKSRSRARMMAGDVLVARPRQATIPAFAVALGVGTMIAIAGRLAASGALNAPSYLEGGPAPAWFATGDISTGFVNAAALALLITTIVTIAISAATATLTARDAATQEALGATRRDGRLAGAITFAAMQLTGIALGVVAGAIGAAWLFVSTLDNTPGVDIPKALSAAVIPTCAILALAAIGAAIGAWVVASFTPSPISASRLESAA